LNGNAAGTAPWMSAPLFGPLCRSTAASAPLLASSAVFVRRSLTGKQGSVNANENKSQTQLGSVGLLPQVLQCEFDRLAGEVWPFAGVVRDGYGFIKHAGGVMLPNVPPTQTVIEIKAPGGPEMLVPTTRPVPEPKAGEVLIRIAAAGINRADTLQRMGRYPMPPGATDIPGLECAGTVVALGADVAAWQLGDQVCALMVGDGYGEYAAVPAGQCLPVPKGMSLIDAGGLPETFCTVWTNVFERLRLQPGEVFLMQGGSSGIGVTAIQLAKAFGAKVLATAGSDEKCQACRDFGADVAINYRREDFVEVGKKFTEGRGVDVILDMVGGDYIPRQIDLLAREGRLGFVALMQGAKVEADFGAIQRKHLTVTGSTLRSRTVEQKSAIVAALREKVWPLWAAGQLRPFTYKTFPLAQAAEAHRLMESSAHIGKIVLVP
jgi:NADPH2:quinone reductase